MPATLPASRLRAGIRASSTSTTRLDFSSTTPVSTRFPYMTMAMNNSTVMMKAAISSSGLRPAIDAELDVLDGHRGHQREELVGIDAGGRRPLLDGDQLDGAGDDRAQLLVGLAPPLQPSRVDDEHVDVLVPDGLLAGGDVVVAVHAHGHIDGVALVGDRPRQRFWRSAGQADIPGARARVDHVGQHDRGHHDDDHHHQAGQEAPGSAPLADLPEGDQPALPQPVHAATAWRKSSDSVGGW